MSGRLVIVLAGPPGAGKTEWARQSGLDSLDWEQCGSAEAWDAACACVASDPAARVVVQRCAPKISERLALAAAVRTDRIYVLATDPATCHVRISGRRRGSATARRSEHIGVSAWWNRYQAHPGHPWPPAPRYID